MGAFRGIELDHLDLRSDRLLLRPWRADDAPAVVQIMQDPRLHEYLALPRPYRLADAVQFIDGPATSGRHSGTRLACALVDAATGDLIGSADLRLPGEGRPGADIGYWIAPAAQGHGYAAEASRMLADWGFRRGIHRIELCCDVRNLASARTALKAGFGYESTRRDGIDAADGHHDLAVFVRTADDPGDPIGPVFAPLPQGALTDGVLTLRTMCVEDAGALAEQDADAASLEFGFSGAVIPETKIRRTAARAGLDWLVGTAGQLSMVDAASARLAGSLQVRRSGPPDVGGIGYTVHPAFRGRGYTARALRLLVPWAFDTAGFARLELGARSDNVASQRAALSGGFEPDGTQRARLRRPDGGYGDEVRFALVNPRYR